MISLSLGAFASAQAQEAALLDAAASDAGVADAAAPSPDAAAEADAGAVANGEAALDGGAPPDAGAVVLGLVPPSPRAPIKPVYPAGLEAQGAVAVGVRVNIDATGAVTAIEITASAGPEFDQAARAALEAAQFAPATRNGQPIAARIPLQVQFLPEPAPPPVGLAVPVAAAPPVPEGPVPDPAAQAVQVNVVGTLSSEEQRRKSSDAVTVVDLREAKKRASDLGEVLARVAGVSVRRYGGLGSEFRFSINGLYDSQIRFFVDGVPIDRVYAMSVVNVPLNLLQDVEIYRGVVPLRLGADALGGAVNLVSPTRYETQFNASYQQGSFNTHRVNFSGRYRHEPTGFVAGASGFFDYSDNSYKIDVEVSHDSGRLEPATVRRFHDAYQAYGAAVEAGVVDKSWAKKLMLRAFTSEYKQQIQSNLVMSVPYGEAHRGETVWGGLLTYQNTFKRDYDLEVVGSYTHRTIDFVDKSVWVYDWYGKRINERRRPGEIEGEPHDLSIWQQGTFGRALFNWRPAPGHQVTATVSPDFVTRTGDESEQADPDARDPLTAEREAFKFVSGLGYTMHLAPMPRAPSKAINRRPQDYRVENVLFGKSYVYRVNSEDPLPGDIFRKRDQKRNRFGAGDAVRIMLAGDYLLMKVSYEYATRLPETDEIFGNGVMIHPNLELKPEYGHNANLGPQLDLRNTKAGDFWLEINGFYRDTRDQIVLLGNERYYTYQNVYRATAMGIENMFKWQSPKWRRKDQLVADGQITYTDQRNISKEGTFAGTEGDRIPNRPWLTAAWGAALHFFEVVGGKDHLEPFYQGRYVEEFFRAWESLGDPRFKQTIPDQISHNVGVTYDIDIGRGRLYTTLEVDNVTDAKIYDLIGAQKPGRAVFLKLVGDM